MQSTASAKSAEAASLNSSAEDLEGFHDAAAAGDIDALRKYIAAGVDIDYAEEDFERHFGDHEGNPALVLAADAGHVEAVRLLLDSGADINREVDHGYTRGTALRCAALNGDLSLIRLLCDRGAKAECHGFEGHPSNPFPDCAAEDFIPLPTRLDCLTALLDARHDINALSCYGETALESSIRKGEMELFSWLIDHGATIYSPDGCNFALTAAAYSRHLDMTKVILSLQDPARRREDLIEALKEAARHSHSQEFMTLLLEGSESIPCDTWTATNGGTALHTACSSGTLSNVKFLLNRGFRVDARMDDGDTPLHGAAWVRFSDPIIKLLHAAGADMNAQDQEGNTALHVAARDVWLDRPSSRGCYQTASKLECMLSRGADPNLRNAAGETALHLCPTREAASYRTLDWSPDLDNDRTCSAAETQAVKVLLAHNVDVNGRDAAGRTALHYAALNGNMDICLALLAAGAVVNIADSRGWTPVFAALTADHMRDMSNNKTSGRCWSITTRAIVEVLLVHGASLNTRLSDGMTILHRIAVDQRDLPFGQGHRKTLEWLFRQGLDANATDLSGRTAQQICRAKGKPNLEEAINTGTLLERATIRPRI